MSLSPRIVYYLAWTPLLINFSDIPRLYYTFWLCITFVLVLHCCHCEILKMVMYLFFNDLISQHIHIYCVLKWNIAWELVTGKVHICVEFDKSKMLKLQVTICKLSSDGYSRCYLNSIAELLSKCQTSGNAQYM